MQKIDIKIDTAELMRLVRETAALYSSKAIVKDPTAFARMEVSEPEESSLLNAARQGRTYIAGVTRRYQMKYAENDTSVWQFTFMVPSNYNDKMTSAIKGSISDYLQYTMLAEWFRLCGDVDRQKEFTEEAAASLQSIVTFINARIAPTYNKPKVRRVKATNFE